jgi:hypothetical protein
MPRLETVPTVRWYDRPPADAGVEDREIVARKFVDGGEQSGDHVAPRTTFCDARHREHHHLVCAFRQSHRREW